MQRTSGRQGPGAEGGLGVLRLGGEIGEAGQRGKRGGEKGEAGWTLLTGCGGGGGGQRGGERQLGDKRSDTWGGT